MPPAIDKPHVPGGISEPCLFNEHSMCINPRCGCSCHKPEINPNIPTPTVTVGPEKACPKCGSRRPATESYCRIDGERLASLLCGVCGSGMNPEDSYCYNCGGPKGAQGPKVGPKVVTVPDIEIGYEQQVLRGLQEELSVQPSDEVDGNKRVVEQPMGTQGSFKLVSAPSPNKIRTGAPVRAQPPRGGKLPTKLPVKPS